MNQNLQLLKVMTVEALEKATHRRTSKNDNFTHRPSSKATKKQAEKSREITRKTSVGQKADKNVPKHQIVLTFFILAYIM
jgi:hypothetical protein